MDWPTILEDNYFWSTGKTCIRKTGTQQGNETRGGGRVYYNLEEELLVKPGRRLGSRGRNNKPKNTRTDNEKLIAAKQTSYGPKLPPGYPDSIVTGIVQKLQTIQRIKTEGTKSSINSPIYLFHSLFVLCVVVCAITTLE